ncbi:MAG: L-threonylcarbamoyladenylate synthase, partial [Solirubrobacteraceae bacterium]|nr:L-threonylcarbamoyladenylate synthase [Solirubrobacteraceae bacterium]
PLACGAGAGQADTLGLRVPAWPPALAALGDVRWPVLQTSANVAGGPDARTLDEVPASIREHTDLVLDGGELPGTPSTVVDLRSFERDGGWSVVREGAVDADAIAAALA